MDLLPEWAPNVHPLLVHFPIALLCTAVLLDAAGLALRTAPFWRRAATVLFVLGAAGAVAAFFTGRAAADSVLPPAAANPVLTEHADLALWTVWFFGIYAVVRLVAHRFDRTATPAVAWALFLVGAGGLVLLYETGEHGAELVFAHGVGVRAAAEPAAPLVLSADTTAGPVPTEDGGWAWKPARAAAWKARFAWPEGPPEALRSALVDGGPRGDVLALEAASGPVTFLYERPLGSLQADLAVHLDGFSGAFRFVHHWQDAQNHHFVALEDGRIRQGRVAGGAEEVMDEAPLASSGWLALRVVADGTHFRAYANGRLVVHGHGPAPSPGPAGLRLDGTGTVLLDHLTVQNLHPTPDADHHP
ncbi:MAG: DUF2231 domain-containing protein [Bacteroidetes bacterium]|nr:MAG: DUF2231 domain-containing protein [Bacteroidota bacterium]